MLPSDISVKKLQHFTGHKAGVYCISSGLTDSTFFTGAGDGVIASWHMMEDVPAIGIARVPGNIFSLELIKSQNLLIAGDMKGGIYVVDLLSKQAVKNLSQSDASVFDLLYMKDKGELIVSTGDGTVYVWEVPEFKLLRKETIANGSIRNISVSPDGNTLVFSSSDHLLYATDRNLRVIHELNGHTNSVFCSAFTPQGNYLISGSRDARLRVWDADNGFALHRIIDAHMFTVNDIAMNPDGKLFATAGRDKHIKIWDVQTFNLLKVIDFEKFGGHINSVNKLFWNHSNNCLISCGDDRAVMVWEVRSGK